MRCWSQPGLTLRTRAWIRILRSASEISPEEGRSRVRLHDGYNQLGGYADTTGYSPVNTPTALIDPSRWQPDITRGGIGIHALQQFVTPQMANVEPFFDFDPREFRVPPPADSDPENWEAYKAQVGRSAGDLGQSQ